MEHTGSDERLEAFRAEMEMQSKIPPKGDERIRAYSLANLEALVSMPAYRRIIQQAIEAKPDYPPSALANFTLRALQKPLIDRERSGYPRIFTTTAPWLEAIELVSDSTSKMHESYLYDVTERDLSSNIANRYGSVKLVAQLMRSRFNERPSILDIGCSQNHGLKKLSMNSKYPFPDIVAGELKLDAAGHVLGLVEEPEATALANQELHQPLRLHRTVGIDTVSIYDEDTRKFAFSCAHRPSELLDEAKVREYRMLDEEEKQHVKFVQGDFAAMDLDAIRKQAGVKRFDIVNFSTVLYQSTEPIRTIMLERAKQLLKPNGVILVQDFVEVEPQDPTRLNYYDNWFSQEYLYRTVMLDPAMSQDAFIELFRWDTSRCNQIVVSTDTWSKSEVNRDEQDQIEDGDFPPRPSDPTFPLNSLQAYAERSARIIATNR
jgi:SAM-dependent methyltransferase